MSNTQEEKRAAGGNDSYMQYNDGFKRHQGDGDKVIENFDDEENSETEENEIEDLDNSSSSHKTQSSVTNYSFGKVNMENACSDTPMHNFKTCRNPVTGVGLGDMENTSHRQQFPQRKDSEHQEIRAAGGNDSYMQFNDGFDRHHAKNESNSLANEQNEVGAEGNPIFLTYSDIFRERNKTENDSNTSMDTELSKSNNSEDMKGMTKDEEDVPDNIQQDKSPFKSAGTKLSSSSNYSLRAAGGNDSYMQYSDGFERHHQVEDKSEENEEENAENNEDSDGSESAKNCATDYSYGKINMQHACCRSRHDFNTSRNPITGFGLGHRSKNGCKRCGYQCKDGNPVTGEGYED